MDELFGILDDVVAEILGEDEDDQLLEGELLFSPEYNMLIQFNPSPKKKGGHYFKVYNNRSSHRATLIARISFHYPIYDLHYKESGRIAKGKKEEKDKQSNWFLSADEKRNLIALLKESNPDYPSRSNWKQLIKKYNDERQNAYRGSDKR